ncbi:MAG: nuclease-related domain-containing protein, partial [Acidimicrobiales bacterium]
MAVIVPEDFDTTGVAESERRVLKVLSDRLDDGWYLVPSIRFAHKGQDREIDILAISANHGAVVLEV